MFRFLSILLIATQLCAVSAYGQSDRNIVVENEWARKSLDKSAINVYFDITNHGADDDELMSVWTPMAE